MLPETVTVDSRATREQLNDIARRYRPRVKGTSRYFPHQGKREMERRARRMGHGQAVSGRTA
jgi:hypothetical protein